MELYKHFKLHSMLKYITVILLIVSTTVKAELEPNFTDKENKLKFFDSRTKEPLFLTCKPKPMPAGNNYNIIWEKNGKDVSKDDGLKNRYKIQDDNLIVESTLPSDAGNYTCRINGTEDKADIQVIANAYLKNMPDSLSVVEGEPLTIHCKAIGTDPQITWTVGNSGDINATHIILKDDEDKVKDAILFIEHAERSDRKQYNCSVRNSATDYGYKKELGAYSDGTYVRVKDKFAALWPFLGICAEVFILCAIILVYEKRRNKEGLDESDTDQSPEQEKLKTGK